MNGTLIIWLGYIVPAGAGIAAMLLLRRRGASGRRQATAMMLTAFALLSVFASIENGRFDVTTFAFLLPIYAVWALVFGVVFRWIDRILGRDDPWDG